MKLFIFNAALASAILMAGGCARHHTKPSAPVAAYHHTPYNKPLSTPGAKFGGLPQAVQTTVLAEAGTAEILEVFKETVGARVIYKISFRDSVTFPLLIVGADGSVLNPDLTTAVPAPQQMATVKWNDLPLSVTRAVQERAPDTEPESITRENWGDHSVYIVSFKDEVRYPKMYVVGDGTLLINAQ
jgi:hypothetical protein